MGKIDYQNPIHLAVLIEGMLAVERPQALLVLTSNPGDKQESYNALVLRVYSNKNNLKSFVGYITFRYNAVQWWRKTEYLPTFSSIECRDHNFKPFPTPRKIHFAPLKTKQEDPAIYTQAQHNSQLTNTPLGNEIGELVLKKAKQMILDFVDGK